LAIKKKRSSTPLLVIKTFSFAPFSLTFFSTSTIFQSLGYNRTKPTLAYCPAANLLADSANLYIQMVSQIWFCYTVSLPKQKSAVSVRRWEFAKSAFAPTCLSVWDWWRSVKYVSYIGVRKICIHIQSRLPNSNLRGLALKFELVSFSI